MRVALGVGVRGRLSVIVSAYNYGHFLGACLRSVLSQDVADLELLVIDDGSQDDTAAVVAGFPAVRYVYQHNQGLSTARNTGMQESSGEYLLFLDADDLLAPRSLAPRLAFLQAQRPIGLSVCRNQQFSTTDAKGEPQLGRSWLLPPCDLGLRLMYFNIAPPHAYLMHRAVADAVGLFDPSLRACEDYDYWLRALALGYEPLFSPTGLVYYRKHVASMSANSNNQLHHDVLLHERVFDALLSSTRLRPSDPACALLAAYAGVFTTLARLPDSSHRTHRRLLALVAASLQALPAHLVDPQRTRWVLREFYLLLLLEQSAVSAARDRQAADAAEAVIDVLGTLRITSGAAVPLHPLRVASHLLLVGDTPLIDRYRVARLLLRRAVHRGAR